MKQTKRISALMCSVIMTATVFVAFVPTTATADGTAPPFAWAIGHHGSGEGYFDYPCGIAIGPRGNIYVADTFNQRIQMFRSDGEFITEWDGLSYPYGVAVSSSGYVYVADSMNNRIQKCYPDGTLIAQWGRYGTEEGQFKGPYSLDVDSSGNVYVADTYNNRIQKFDSNGGFITEWGSYGFGESEFNNPTGLTTDSSGNVYVADTYNYRIQKFDSDGWFITEWGSYGAGDGNFIYPRGMAVDPHYNVYVADEYNCRIQMFESDGDFIMKWGGRGTSEGQFYYPCDIALDSSGNVYVADTENYRIQMFGRANEPPVAEAGADQSDYLGTEFSFDGSASEDPDGYIIAWDWDFGDGSEHGSGETTSHTYSDHGEYNVYLRVRDDDGIPDDDVLTVTVLNNPPVAEAGEDQTACALTEMTFVGSQSYDLDGTIVSWEWDFGQFPPMPVVIDENGNILPDPDYASGMIVKHTYSKTGVYTVTLVVTDDDGDCFVDTCAVNIPNYPPVAVAGDAQHAFRFEQIYFDGSGSYDPDTYGSIDSYYWDFGDGTPDGYGVNPSHIYSERGTYIVTLTVTDNDGVTDSDTTKVYVSNNPPVAEAGEDQTAYALAEMIFDGSQSIDPDGTIISWEWDFGEFPPMPVVKDENGNIPPNPDYASGEILTHTYSKPGAFTVTLVVTDDNGDYSVDTCVVNILNNPPVAEAGQDQAVHLGDSVTFDGTGSFDVDDAIVDYYWDFGDGQSCGYGPSPVYAYSELGTYTVTLEVFDKYGASDTDTMTVTVYNDPPVADAGSDVTIYLGTGITFVGSGSYDPDGTIISYDWEFGDDISYGSGDSPYYVYSEHGVFTVTLVVTDNDGATSEDTCTVTVLDNPPVASAGIDRTVYLGTTITFDGSGSNDPDGSIITYDWNFGDGTDLGSDVKPSHTYTHHGVYTVTLIVTDNDGSISEDTCTVTVQNNAPVASAGSDLTIMVDEIGSFDGSGSTDVDGSITSCDWDWGDGSTHGSGATPTHSYSTAGVYTVTLTVTDDDGSTSSDTLTVTVLAPAGATEDLVDTIEDLGLDTGTTTSLVQPLGNAITALNSDNPHREQAAIRELNAFIHSVEGKRGKKLTNEEADALIAYAQWIIDNI